MNSLIISSPSDADQRIDKFIRKYFPNAPLGGIFKWLRTGKVKINGKKVEQNHRIEQGDVIEFYLSEEEIEEMRGDLCHPDEGRICSPDPEQKQMLRTSAGQNNISQSILYEDEYLMIVDKSAGINVHPGDHKTTEVSLIELVQDYLGKAYNTLSFKPSLVHRIDRDTSGCIMIAKNKKMLEALLDLLQHDGIEKVYHTIVIGSPEKSRDTISARLLRIENAKNEAKVRVDPSGQEAVTHYQTLKTITPYFSKSRVSQNQEVQGRKIFSTGVYGSVNDRENNFSNEEIRRFSETPKYSLLECQIETGRTHQIRVHLSHIGHPILGDKAYGEKGENSHAKRNFGIERQMLHARSLTFIHPITKRNISIVAPYPEDFEKLIAN